MKWADKAKEAAISAAEEAKKAANEIGLGGLVAKAGEITKAAVEEAKKITGSFIDKSGDSSSLTPEQSTDILQRLENIEKLLQAHQEAIDKLADVLKASQEEEPKNPE